jgi:tetratricopeptide (TPR) repeat protein
MFRGFFSLFIPAFSGRNRKPKRRVQGAARVAGANFQPTDAAAGAGPRVLLADLAGDRGGAATGHVTNALSRCGCIEVFRANQVLKMSKAGNIVQQLVMAADKGRGWMEEQGADLLLWGELEEHSIRLRFLPMIPSSDSLPGAVGLGDALALPLDFNETFDPVLHAGVLAAIGPTFKGSRGRIAEFLAPALQGTKVFIQAPPDGLNEDQNATVLTTIGNAFAAHFRLGGGDKKLGNAGATYKMALKKISSEQAPEIWAVAQSHYASVLKAQGDGKTDEATEALKNAAVAYQKITETLSRVAHPYDWALAHINHGLVLYRLSGRSGRAAYLQEASKSFEEALTVYTKEAMPPRWAEVTNQYGVILLAIKRFRQALEIRKRDKMPLLWAQTANNLGAACFSLAKRNAEAALLREASSCFEGAVEIYQTSGAAKKAEVIRNNLSRVERLLSARGG